MILIQTKRFNYHLTMKYEDDITVTTNPSRAHVRNAVANRAPLHRPRFPTWQKRLGIQTPTQKAVSVPR